ncbi:MAG: hypothetical protein P8Y18_08650 [Candidatus Bathyarchaeota archaeon]
MIEEFIKSIKGRETYKKQIVHLEKIPAQEAVYGQLDKPLPKVIQNFLVSNRILLYSHQAEAINKIREGKNVVKWKKRQELRQFQIFMTVTPPVICGLQFGQIQKLFLAILTDYTNIFLGITSGEAFFKT